MGFSEHQLRRQALECLVAVLRSLVVWGTTAGKSAADPIVEQPSLPQVGEELRQDMLTPDMSSDRLSTIPSNGDTLRQTSPDITDDPTRFESAKQKKTTLLEGIKKFNFKPKRVGGLPSPLLDILTIHFQGIQFLIETGFIKSKAPEDVAKFLLATDGLNKTMIGEYLGEA
jgi:brefeldin A-inhibited guanine nucleotide-exchange protein